MTEQEKAEAVAYSYAQADDDADAVAVCDDNDDLIDTDSAAAAAAAASIDIDINETTDSTTTLITTNVAEPFESASNVLFGAVVEDIETIVNGSRLGIWCDDDQKYYPCTVVKITKEEGVQDLLVQYDHGDGENECHDFSLYKVCRIIT